MNWKHGLHVVIIVLGLLTLQKVITLFESEIDGEVTLLGRDEQGRIRVGEVKVKKYATKKPKNLVDLSIDTDGSRSIDYRRRWGDSNFFGGVGYRKHSDGSESYSLGLSIEF